MKIIADENIPYAQELFAELGELTLLPGRSMQAEDVQDADILLVRSVTPINADLLQDSKIRFVGTCTIGVDHLDTGYLQQNNISFASAPGCNANAVAQYVLAALATIDRLTPEQKVVVVGGGNVGSRVYKQLKQLGMDCYCVDPFLSSNEDMRLVPFERVYTADIVCLHTPLTSVAPHPTHHMFSQQVIEKLKPGAVLLNAGRGGVIDNHALLNRLQAGQDLNVILDVWENEPAINVELLQKVNLGTPHIAGYSFEGRVTGSIMIYRKLCKFLGYDDEVIERQITALQSSTFGEPIPVKFSSLYSAILNSYLISEDYSGLLDAIPGLPASFDKLRKDYHQRREFSHYRLLDVPHSQEFQLKSQLKSQLQQLGFVLHD